MFPKFLLMTFPLFPYCSLSLKILPVFAENFIFEPAQVFNHSPVSTAEWYITLHHWYIVSALKIIIYDSITCFCLRTSKMYVKLNII